MTGSLRNIVTASATALMLLSPIAAQAQGRFEPRPEAQHHSQSRIELARHDGPQGKDHDRRKPEHPRAQHGKPHHAQQHRPQPHQQHWGAPQRPQPQAHWGGPQKPHPVYRVHPGQSAAKGRHFQRGKSSRFAPPPRGYEYRVVNDHLVLADSKTLQIVTVMGLLNALLR